MKLMNPDYCAVSRTGSDGVNMNDELKRLQELNRSWNREMSRAGMAGSEFFDDPARCADFIRDRQNTTLSMAKDKADLRARLSAFEAQEQSGLSEEDLLGVFHAGKSWQERAEKSEERVKALEEATTKAHTFIEYARYELEEKHEPFEQFPCQECADKYLKIIKTYLLASPTSPAEPGTASGEAEA